MAFCPVLVLFGAREEHEALDLVPTDPYCSTQPLGSVKIASVSVSNLAGSVEP